MLEVVGGRFGRVARDGDPALGEEWENWGPLVPLLYQIIPVNILCVAYFWTHVPLFNPA